MKWLMHALTVAALITMPGSTTAKAGVFSATDARRLIDAALAAQGGADALRALRTIAWTGTGYRNMLEQSERPEGPYVTEFQTVTTEDDYEHSRYRSTIVSTTYPYGSYATGLVIADRVAMKTFEGARSAGSADLLAIERERSALSPERLLLTAAAANGLRRDQDIMLQEVPHNVVEFMLDGAPVRIFLNANTHLPTAIDYSGPIARSGYWSFLGDVTQRTYYGFWSLQPGGVRYPLQWNVESNGLPDRMIQIHDLRLNPVLTPSDFVIPETIRKAFASTPVTPKGDAAELAKGQEISPGVVFIPGAWNVTLVRQRDGVVVLEAPISPGYSKKVLAEVARRFPGVPVKAVVTTSDAWPHFAGIREYAARGVPIYALDLNVPLLQRNVGASYGSKPDLQERSRRVASFRIVRGRTGIGSGDNRIELYPLRGETTERQMMVYLPGARLLYGSDAFQRGPDGSFAFPQTVDELTSAVNRDCLHVDRFFMMHLDPTPWNELDRAPAEEKKASAAAR